MRTRRSLTAISIGTISASLFAVACSAPAQRTEEGKNPGAGPAVVRPTAEPVAAPPAPRPSTPVRPASGADRPATAVGAYLHYGPAGVRRMKKLSRWLDGTNVTVGHTYLPGDLWSNIEGRPGFLRPWAKWKRGSAERMFVLNVPMMEGNEDHVSDRRVRSLLRAGARGDFDKHYRKLAEHLVNLGVPDTVIVLGWEMNGTTYTHRCGPDPQSWKTYWRSIVAEMRSVPGQKFRFDFAPNRGLDAVAWTKCYPGDDVVDIIGMDSYDQPPGVSFDDQVRTPYGLQHQVDFAAAHGKAISYPEWGLFRNGDNPEYTRRMLDWFAQHKPLYQTITDYCPHGVWQCAENPESSAVFRKKLSAKPTTVPPKPTTPTQPKPTTPTPTKPNPDNWCLPWDLGDWLGRWLPELRSCAKPYRTPSWNR
ncbi:glycoside hydrolase family 26 protein [Streptomyces sp. NPDC091272]|uniref:glycoside hydrolase family 26 protein n=1 Tax=Streptomyces sp. NPDC091272 TaxID=3365981 RepID=UPI003800B39D